jgi:hypothetical protein
MAGARPSFNPRLASHHSGPAARPGLASPQLCTRRQHGPMALIACVHAGQDGGPGPAEWPRWTEPKRAIHRRLQDCMHGRRAAATKQHARAPVQNAAGSTTTGASCVQHTCMCLTWSEDAPRSNRAAPVLCMHSAGRQA